MLTGVEVRVGANREWQLGGVEDVDIGRGQTAVLAGWHNTVSHGWLFVETDDLDGPVRVRAVDWRVPGFDLDQADPSSVAPSRSITAAQVRDLASDLPRLASLGHAASTAARGAVHTDGASRLRRRSSLTTEFLSEVAEVYLAGGTRGRANVARHFGREPSTVDHWIKTARERGLLGPAPKRGRAGQITRKDKR